MQLSPNITFNSCFKIEKNEDIRKYFPHDKTSLKNKIGAKINRIKHLLQRGVWINESKVCKWASEHNDQKISDLFSDDSVQRKVIRYENNMVVAKVGFCAMILNIIKFIIEFFKHPKTVGAILPSSKRLSREIVREIPKDLKADSRLILEIGPGSGSFTDKIIKRMNPKDELHLVEFDEKFCKTLQKKYEHIPNVKIFHKSILDHTSDRKYDYVISGLPLNAFKSDFVESILNKYTELTKKDGKLSYFEYLWLPQIKKIFSSAAENKNLNQILHLKNEFYNKHKFRKANVYLNIPFARVVHHQMNIN